jgi:hypothetical protein
MLCPACGKTLEEGKLFCKYCGARQAPDTATMPVSPPAWTPTPPPPPRSSSKTGLIVAIAIVAVLLVGAGVATAFFLLAPKESKGERAQTSGVVVATTPSGTGTTATVPAFDPNGAATTLPSTNSTVSMAGYLQAIDALETVLTHCDERLPTLAGQINTSAPRVPGSVSQELDKLNADVEKARSALGEFEPPSAYEQADQLIFEAADAMQNRIDQTSKGIDAMWNEGTVAAGTPYFEEGRKARDEFRALFDQYTAAKP